MIRTWLFASGKLTAGDEKQVEVWKAQTDSLIWVDFGENDQFEATPLLQSTFGLHTLAIQDAQRDRHPPKIEAFDEQTFILMKGLSADSENIDFSTIQLALFVGKRYLVTHHSGASVSIQRLTRILAEQSPQHFDSAAKLATQLCRLVADRYLNILLALESRLEELEDLMLEKANDTLLAELIKYKSDLKRMRRFATYHEHLFRKLKDKDFPGFDGAERRHEVIDVWEQQERIQSLSQLYYETASDLIDGYISVASHHLNQIMKVLTIVMAVFVPLSFLAGIYGMNFENMPELHSRSGYYILLSVMGFIAFLLLLGFRRMKWL
ncbi:MAG: magnesium transporter CorA family protein [Pseudomonadota bacterium]